MNILRPLRSSAAALAPALAASIALTAGCGDDNERPVYVLPVESSQADAPVNSLDQSQLRNICESYSTYVEAEISFDTVTHALCLATAILSGALFGLFLAYQTDLPQVSSLEDFKPNIITQVFAADDSLIGEFSIERRVIVEFGAIPPQLRSAIVAVEDADFWRHLGINPWRIPAAALANLRSGRRGQGFSTLTMQLSRLLFLTPEKTYERKIKEIILAFQIEKNFTKEEIFTLYCNQIYFGHGTYGVAAAGQFFFSKSLAELTARWEMLQRRWDGFLATLTAESLDQTVYKNSTSSGHAKRHGTRRSDILLHLCTHSQYTTAQVVNMLRQLGLSPLPDIDPGGP